MTQKLTVIQGKKNIKKATKREFVSGYITDTRLMGVTVLFMRFTIFEDGEKPYDLCQFFYYDSEEYGLDNYVSLRNPLAESIESVEDSLAGGLGARKIPVSLKEGAWLLKEYVKFNFSHNIPLPGKVAEYQFIINMKMSLPAEDINAIWEKECVKLTGPFETINYFVMRLTGNDMPAVKYLMAKEFSVNPFPFLNHGTLYRNSITPLDEENTYLCESLTESDGVYYNVTNEIELDGLFVSSFKMNSYFKISPIEAAMITRRPETISIFKYSGNEAFHKNTTLLTKKAMVNKHENGVLYMMFNDNNNHVRNQIYNLNEDVLGIYYVLNNGQLLAISYNDMGRDILFENLEDSPIANSLELITEYDFVQSVFYEFLETGYDDFQEYISDFFPNFCTE